MALTKEIVASSPFAQASTKNIGSDGQAKDKLNVLVMDIMSKKQAAANARTAKEAQWREALRQYRGQDNEQFRESEHSKVSLRTTTVKVKAALGQITEALFNDGRFPLKLTETRVPEGVYEFAHIADGGQQQQPSQNQPQQPYVSSIGFQGDGRDLVKGATFDMLGSMFQGQPMDNPKVQEGAGINGEPTVAPAKEAAGHMEQCILDQLEGCHASAHLDKTVFEACVLGTGAFKGPFNEEVECPYWEKNPDGTRSYKPQTKLRPKVTFVSLWDLYIDPSCDTNIQEAEWVIERHKLNTVELYDLKNRPLFNASAIDSLVSNGPNYSEQSGDDVTADQDLNVSNARHNTLYEVWEYWGYMSKNKLAEYGLSIPDEAGDYVQINAWISGNYVLRITLNPFTPARIPYYVFPYERDPYSIYGTGVPYAMADQQKLINGFMRMAVDNLALAGNLVFDVDETALVPGQDMSIEPGKIFRRVGGAPGQGVYGIKFPSTANENLQMVREARQYADESTGIPSLAHGQVGVSGYGRTASGMSMILNNASLNIKTVVRNIDEFLIAPLGQAMFAWNMQFNSKEHPDIVGDLEIKATGARSLEQKDVEVQRLQTFLQLSMNPAIAPLIKLPNVVKRLAQVMDMQPEDILNTPEEAQFYAALMGQQGMQQQGGGQPNIPNPMGQGNFQSTDGGAGNEAGVNGNVAGVNAPQQGAV